jgi:hypothetical protein
MVRAPAARKLNAFTDRSNAQLDGGAPSRRNRIYDKSAECEGEKRDNSDKGETLGR